MPSRCRAAWTARASPCEGTATAGSGGAGQLEQLLTKLTRADIRTPVRNALGRLLNAHLPDLVDAAVEAPPADYPICSASP